MEHSCKTCISKFRRIQTRGLKTFDYPPAQPNMPKMQKLIEKGYIIDGISPGFYFTSIKPAVNVFKRHKKDLKNIELPEDARKYLN